MPAPTIWWCAKDEEDKPMKLRPGDHGAFPSGPVKDAGTRHYLVVREG